MFTIYRNVSMRLGAKVRLERVELYRTIRKRLA